GARRWWVRGAPRRSSARACRPRVPASGRPLGRAADERPPGRLGRARPKRPRRRPLGRGGGPEVGAGAAGPSPPAPGPQAPVLDPRTPGVVAAGGLRPEGSARGDLRPGPGRGAPRVG